MCHRWALLVFLEQRWTSLENMTMSGKDTKANGNAQQEESRPGPSKRIEAAQHNVHAQNRDRVI
jgi:hypothetical protein